MVADEGPCGIGDVRRDTGLPDGLDHDPDGERGKIGGGAGRVDGPVLGLRSGIVRNAGVVYIDGHPLRRDDGAACGLPHADHQLGLMRPDRLDDGLLRAAKGRGHLQRDHRKTGTLDALHSLQRRVDSLAAKGVKAGEQDPAAGFGMIHNASPFRIGARS